MVFMELKLLTNNEFLEFSKKFSPSSIYQTTYYAFTMNEQNQSSLFLGLFDDNTLIGATMVLIYKENGFRYAVAPRGFLINYDNDDILVNFTNLIKRYLSKHDVVAIKINPMIVRGIYNFQKKLVYKNPLYDETFKRITNLGYFHLGYNNKFEALKPRFEAVVNLDVSLVQMFANIDKSYRNKIRKALRDGVKVYQSDESNLEYLYLQVKKKYPRDLSYFKNLYNFFDKDALVDFYYSKLDTTEYLQYTHRRYNEFYEKSVEAGKKLIASKGGNEKLINEKLRVDKMVTKYKNQLSEATDLLKNFPNGIVISSALVIKWKDTVYLAFDGLDEKYKKFNGKHLMIWKLMGRYSKLGFKKFDLGGVSNVAIHDDKYDGLNSFKLNFHSDVIEYAGDFELICNKPLYFLYKNSFGISTIFKK